MQTNYEVVVTSLSHNNVYLLGIIPVTYQKLCPHMVIYTSVRTSKQTGLDIKEYKENSCYAQLGRVNIPDKISALQFRALNPM